MISLGRISSILLIANLVPSIRAPVSPGQVDRLTREQLLQLDSDVSQYFVESYEELDSRESRRLDYDAQLYRSIKAIRHTNVVHHLDFRYTSNETHWASMGARVDAKLCVRHLEIVKQLAQGMLADPVRQTTPLSVLDFFEASGKTGSGILNGNFVWLGSYISCESAKLPARVYSRLLATGNLSVRASELLHDIRGRYCVAHLRARSWPAWDTHFEDRVTLRRGVCLPESCHSALYATQGDDKIRQLVDYLARFDLLPPFNGERYETQTLYCLPDEDSAHRQLDLGARLFLAFLSIWALLTLYANIKYNRRALAVRRLRDTVDITMIFQEPAPDEVDGTEDEQALTGACSRGASPTRAHLGALGGDPMAPAGSALSSAQSSACSTPLPSDFEDADMELVNMLEPFRVKRRTRVRKANANFTYSSNSREPADGRDTDASAGAPDSELFDVVRDFSIESNLSWLLKPRASRLSAKRPASNNQAPPCENDHHLHHHHHQPQVGGQISRRASNSNEALLRELQASRCKGLQAKVAAATKSPSEDEPAAGKRVDVDVLDGLKVLATIWIVLGHTMMFFFIFLQDIRFGVDRMFDLTMTMLINTLQVVGLFYVITGCLLTYLAFSRAKRTQLLNPLFWLLVLVGRYIRLLPVYLLVFWFARHVAPHTGHGRDWLDYRTDDEHPRGHCARESWWVMLSMSAADVKIPMDCVPQAWYLSDDFRTLLVLPAYVLLLATSARLGYAAILATVVYSTFRLAAILKAASIDYKILLMWQPHVYALMVDRLHDVYTDFYVRMSTYLLGVVVGHLLHLYEIRVIREWPRWLKMRVPLFIAGCFFFGVQLLSSPWVNQFLPARERLNSAHVVWLIPLFKGAMELSLAVIILLLITGGGHRWARAVLSSQAMKILSGLSYAVFLTHVEVMYKLPITRLDSNYWQLLLYGTCVVSLSHAVAFLVHLLYEMPLNNLSRRLLKRAANLIS